ncbi:MAG: ATP-binding cassette domain-containing protein [Gudongella sp.]|nr:ATP-binding cassette domain-containing protein [Gudongella sp.]
MKEGNAVEVRNVTKRFNTECLVAGPGSPNGRRRRVSRKRTVLEGIDLEISKGETFGLVGRNGSGKSTLLKILSSVMYPDSGEVEVSGKVASVLELGMGFHRDLSGRENIRIKGSMYGFSEKEMDGMMDEIISYSGLEEQIDDPVRIYSSGMHARLAFAVAVNVKCDVIIVDEILSVGDAGFRVKCSNSFREMKKRGMTIILASHSKDIINSMCDRVAWIDGGRVRDIGSGESVCYRYEKSLTDCFDTVAEMAETGDPAAQNRLGEMYRDGSGVAEDPGEAVRWFRKAADRGLPEAQLNLADMMYYGTGTEEDRAGAETWYRLSADAGNPDAQIRLAETGNPEPGKDREKIMERLRGLAEGGCLRAQASYADCLFRGIGVKQDRREAMRWFSRAAEAGSVSSQFQLGLNYRDGLGTEKNGELAEIWLSKAAGNHHMRAKIELANMFLKGMAAERDLPKALRWFKDAATSGDAKSFYQTAVMYRDGMGTESDPEESRRWFDMFADQAYLRVQNNLADILFRMDPSDRERQEAADIHAGAAGRGSIASAYQLGIIYRDGLGRPRDGREAERWLGLAASRGHQGAMIDLGNMYLKGNGVDKDEVKAAGMFTMASDTGNHIGTALLGTMYMEGLGFEKDPVKARELFLRSSEFGNREALKNLKRV